MSARRFDEFDIEVDDFSDAEEANITEASPSTKLERRRKIEDLFEERRLREELSDFE
ncbi:PA3496 family putative envelope integrity protein [Legionella waltersii]|uniref:Uncharacterized protein n=1 Tax=Legionella waltersii TaxID=66969 RepID=A0A0W1A1J5_9GAMM|nr:hypothetical protein [Legionella waltersii]KTD75239.1 hypothetical protein Lwal_3280 [Legionella waltersii]SNV06654.1 Uncharacterised protein [Legionella waltersii]